MDPNENLRQIRELLTDHTDGACDELDALAQLVGDLDVWLSKGGLLPSAWSREGDPTPGGAAAVIHSLTTESDKSTVTTLHASEEDATASIFENFDSEGEYGDDLQALMDAYGVVVHIEPHDVSRLLPRAAGDKGVNRG